MATYDPGDRVFLFGFSRGAHDGSMPGWQAGDAGAVLLEKAGNNLVPYASKHYLEDAAGYVIVAGVKQTLRSRMHPLFCRRAEDSVAAMGWFWGNEFSDSRLNSDIPYGYQAWSMGERPKHFVESVWD